MAKKQDWWVAFFESSPGYWKMAEYRAESYIDAIMKAPGRLGDVKPGRMSRRSKGALE